MPTPVQRFHFACQRIGNSTRALKHWVLIGALLTGAVLAAFAGAGAEQPTHRNLLVHSKWSVFPEPERSFADVQHQRRRHRPHWTVLPKHGHKWPDVRDVPPG